MKYLVRIAALSAVLVAPSAAMAQDQTAEFFVGGSAGYHDFGIDDEIEGLDLNDDGFIYGVVAGVDVPVGETLFAGIEGNFHLGTGAIDKEYGVSARLGMVGSNGAKYYVRGGYQEIDFDVSEIAGIDIGEPNGFDSSDGDYMVGVGADFPIGSAKLRLNLDTVSFDTIRASTGVVFDF